MRYTECRLTEAAHAAAGRHRRGRGRLPRHLRRRGRTSRSSCRPGFPNLLANGSSGIAVGMATSIPPHNAGELIDACLILLDRPSATTAELMEHGPGPGLPDRRGDRRAARLAARDLRDRPRRGARARHAGPRRSPAAAAYRIIVTEIPYQVQKADLIEQLADLIENKKAPLLGDVRDESAEDVRLVLEPKSRNIEPEVLMESLFKLSDLETRFPVNMNVLDARGTPRRDGAEAGAAGLPRSPARGAGPPRPLPPGQDRGAAAHPGRPADRLPQSGRGDPHRPLRGGAQGQADRDVRA